MHGGRGGGRVDDLSNSTCGGKGVRARRGWRLASQPCTRQRALSGSSGGAQGAWDSIMHHLELQHSAVTAFDPQDAGCCCQHLLTGGHAEASELL